jgi:hypothetical protein
MRGLFRFRSRAPDSGFVACLWPFSPRARFSPSGLAERLVEVVGRRPVHGRLDVRVGVEGQGYLRVPEPFLRDLGVLVRASNIVACPCRKS